MSIKNLLFFSRNTFDTSHPKEYRWSQGDSLVPKGSVGLNTYRILEEALGFPESHRGPGASRPSPTFPPCHFFLNKHYLLQNKIYCSNKIYLFIFFTCLLTVTKGNYILLLWRKCSLKLDSKKIYFQWHVFFKGNAKIVKIYRVTFNVTILSRPKMRFQKFKVKTSK